MNEGEGTLTAAERTDSFSRGSTYSYPSEVEEARNRNRDADYTSRVVQPDGTVIYYDVKGEVEEILDSRIEDSAHPQYDPRRNEGSYGGSALTVYDSTGSMIFNTGASVSGYSGTSQNTEADDPIVREPSAASGGDPNNGNEGNESGGNPFNDAGDGNEGNEGNEGAACAAPSSSSPTPRSASAATPNSA